MADGQDVSCLSAPETTRDQVIGDVVGVLLAITVRWEIMQLDARAQAMDDPVDGPADELGDPPGNPGTIDNGALEVIVGANLGGTGLAARP